MHPGAIHDYLPSEATIPFDPRRHDRLGERWVFRAPDLQLPAIPLEFPEPNARFPRAAGPEIATRLAGRISHAA